MRKISIRQVKSSIRYFYTVFLHLGIYYWQGKLQLPQRAMFILLLPFLFYIEPLWTVESCSQTSEGRRQVRRGAWLPPSYNFFHANNWANKWSSVQNVEIFIFISCREVAGSSDWQWRTHCLRSGEVWGAHSGPHSTPVTRGKKTIQIIAKRRPSWALCFQISESGVSALLSLHVTRGSHL